MTTKKIDFVNWASDKINDYRTTKERHRGLKVTDADIMSQCELMAAKGYLPIDTEAFQQLAAFMAWREKEVKRGLLLQGPCGTGKTMWLEKFGKVKVWGAGHLVKIFQKKESTLWDIMRPPRYDVLPASYGDIGIDDLGAENQLKYSKDELFKDVISERYKLFKKFGYKTYITTNLTNEQIEKRYNTRIMSRIVEMTTPVQFTANDVRKGL